MKFHQIFKTAQAYVASKSIWKYMLLNITKHNSLDLVHREAYFDWLDSC